MIDHINRILGIDYGSKRIGVAVSDPHQQFALPVSVVSNGDDAVNEIDQIAKQHEVNEIVLGESRNYKGEPNLIFEAADEFKKEIEKLGYIVYLELEFMTSVHAERFQGKNDKLDSSAAALILQSYLDRKKAQNN